MSKMECKRITIVADSNDRNGKWEMGNGKWEMGNGKWEMGNGKWEMGNGKWEIISHLPVK